MYNDCVVIPGWGALIANYASSSVESGKVARPGRLIGFNSTISHNDGMLATSLMRRHGIGYEQACSLIADNVTTFRRHLAGGNELAFGRLGYFKLGDQEKLEFVPMTQVASCDEFFGLENVPILTLEQQCSAGNDAVVLATVAVSWRERMKVAASIKTANAPKTTTPQVTMKPAAQAKASDRQFVVIDDKGVEKPVNAPFNQEESLESSQNEEMPSSGNFLLVIKSCDSQKRAESKARYYSKHGVDTWIVYSGNKYNLVAAQSDSKKELRQAKKRLPSKYRSAKIMELE